MQQTCIWIIPVLSRQSDKRDRGLDEWVTYSVWVYFQGELPIGCADVLVVCFGREPEQFVGVNFWLAGHERWEDDDRCKSEVVESITIQICRNSIV